MTNLHKKVVWDAAQNLISEDMRLPSPVWLIVSGLHSVHRIWRWFRMAELVSDKNNLPYLTAGHLTQFFLKKNSLVQGAARILLIANRVQQCAEEQVTLKQSGQRWLRAVKGDYAIKFYPVNFRASSFLSPSCRDALQKGVMDAAFRVAKIGLETVFLVKSTFRITMCLMDAIEAFRGTSEAKRNAVHEMYLNGKMSFDFLIKNKKVLCRLLMDQKSAINEVLTTMKIPHKTEQLVETIKQDG